MKSLVALILVLVVTGCASRKQPPQLAAPSELTIVPEGSRLKLTWAKVDGASFYFVYRDGAVWGVADEKGAYTPDQTPGLYRVTAVQESRPSNGVRVEAK